jgi:hypothetical protein
MLTGTALLLPWLVKGTSVPRTIERLAALCTGAAVLQHGWREIRERGYFDPEVLSLTYLLRSSYQGDYGRGALITWMLTFGRHLLAGGGEGVEIRPMRREPEGGGAPQYEAVVVGGGSRQAPLFSVLQSLARYLGAAGGPGQPGLLGELRAVSSAHGEMVEGLGWMRDGIPMRFR